MRKFGGWSWLWLVPLAYLILYAANLPFRRAGESVSFDKVAHRGVHHTFHGRDLSNTTCTATRIDPPRHEYIENTLASMRAAFAAGATRVELDIHRTKDGQLAVFHDWSVDCRTQGSGETRAHSLAELQALDIGFGYTADGGNSFPLRGKGVAALPSLAQVLDTFPEGQFVIDQKDRDAATTSLLMAQLQAHSALPRACLYAIPERERQFLAQEGACSFSSKHLIKRCLIDYLSFGWSGHVPMSCRNQRLVVPTDVRARWLWGWPGTFIERMRAHGTQVYAFADYGSEAEYWQSLGFDGLWTDRIEQ